MKKLSAKITRKKKQHDEDAADQVAEDKLNKGEISAVGDGGSADDGECGGFCCDDGKSQSPPGRGSAAQEIVEADGFAVTLCDVFFAAAEAHAQRGDGEEIGDDDGEIERMDAH